MKLKVISGGQTGVDQAALSAAKKCGLSTGGYAPKGYRTELGGMKNLLKGYGLEEMITSDYPSRTRANISISHATLIIDERDSTELTGGTKLTWDIVCEVRKTRGIGLYLVHLTDTPPLDCIEWVRECMSNVTGDVFVLNVAGPAESHHKGIEDKAESFLVTVFKSIVEAPKEDQK